MQQGDQHKLYEYKHFKHIKLLNFEDYENNSNEDKVNNADFIISEESE